MQDVFYYIEICLNAGIPMRTMPRWHAHRRACLKSRNCKSRNAATKGMKINFYCTKRCGSAKFFVSLAVRSLYAFETIPLYNPGCRNG